MTRVRDNAINRMNLFKAYFRVVKEKRKYRQKHTMLCSFTLNGSVPLDKRLISLIRAD